MAKLRSITISSLQDFTVVIDALPKKEIHWYRGCGEASYELIPTLYRHPEKRLIGERLQLENDLLSWFRDRSVLYEIRQLALDWEYLFFMQHFRVPTRLLDWTENPFIALYFALTSEPSSTDENAALWVLEPEPWNQRALEEISYGARIPYSSDDELRAHEPRCQEELLRPRPVAMFGMYSSIRMAAQRGTFVIFGKEMSPMEDIYTQDNFPADALVKLEIPAKSRASLFSSLLRVGITDSVVLPDIEGLAMEARRHFGFEV